MINFLKLMGFLTYYVGEYLQTDTASVLMEAIGYINFLQTQVEVYHSYYLFKTFFLVPTNKILLLLSKHVF